MLSAYIRLPTNLEVSWRLKNIKSFRWPAASSQKSTPVPICSGWSLEKYVSLEKGYLYSSQKNIPMYYLLEPQCRKYFYKILNELAKATSILLILSPFVNRRKKFPDLALSIQIEAHNEASTFSHKARYFAEIYFQLFKT